MDDSPIAAPDSNLEVAAHRDSFYRQSPSGGPIPQPIAADSTVNKSYTQPIYAEKEVRMLPTRHESRNPFGMSSLIYGLVVGLVTALIVGAAVGGGVGSALRSHHLSCTVTVTATATPAPSLSTSTDISSTTSPTGLLEHYVASPPESIKTLQYDCIEIDQSERTTVRGQTYRYSCFNIYTGDDWASIFVYSIEACVEACSSMNFLAGLYNRAKGSRTCLYIAYNTLINGSLGGQYANCWLKGDNVTLETSTGAAYYIGAELVTG